MFGSKLPAKKNYIDVSNYFKDVLFCVITPYVSSPTELGYFTTEYQGFKNGKVLYHCARFFNNDIQYRYSPTVDDNGLYCSCSYIVVGLLK